MDKQEEELRRMGVGVERDQDSLRATFLSDFLFDFDSAELKPDAYRELDRVADVLRNYPETTIRIEGHTDSTGPDDYNQALSERRAQTVKNTLARRGVEPWRLDTVGYGESYPVSSSAAANRRVVIVINPIRQS
jgi:outer membrane protein OmpA-like peptidoglycan-associated protein